MKELESINIKDFNTLSVSCVADKLIHIESEKDLLELIKKYDFKNIKYLILGEGSKLVLPDEYKGIVIKDELKGKEIISENDEHVFIKVASGESWIDFVIKMSEKEYSGIENLAFIPGTVGAAAVQNIGAYGQVAEDVIEEVEVINLFTGEKKVFKNKKCKYSYRHSIFKEEEMKKYFVTSVTIKLNKYQSFDTNYHSRYENESLKLWLEKNAKQPYKPIDIVHSVTELRRFKLPSVDEFGTCGSFFINPFITRKKYDELVKLMPDLQCYPVDKMDYSANSIEDIKDEEIVKIPVARLVDELGWKGKWIGNVGCHKNQALCVITNRKASSKEVRDFTRVMAEDVKKNYGIDILPEVTYVD